VVDIRFVCRFAKPINPIVDGAYYPASRAAPRFAMGGGGGIYALGICNCVNYCCLAAGYSICLDECSRAVSIAVGLSVVLKKGGRLVSIRQVGHKVVHGHIENMRTRVHDHVLPWEGDMDLFAYLQELAEVGFNGGLALDLYKYDYEDVAPECIRYISKFLERIGAS
jgi:hypothetical protein